LTKGQRYRFSLLLEEIKKAETEEYVACLLAFINCIIAGAPDISARVRLRNEVIGTVIAVEGGREGGRGVGRGYCCSRREGGRERGVGRGYCCSGREGGRKEGRKGEGGEGLEGVIAVVGGREGGRGERGWKGHGPGLSSQAFFSWPGISLSRCIVYSIAAT
jgi:hypothetical protein